MSSRSASSAPVIDFFVHVPKTAGTTMAGVIAGQYPPGTMYQLRGVTLEERIKAFSELPESCRIIAGHAPLNMRRHLPRSSRAFTVLREPVARLLSLYAYIGREKKHPWHELYHSGGLSLQECARRQRNLQTRYLSGVERPVTLHDDELLARAKHEIEHGLATFGLAERFEETILLFNAMLGWDVRFFTSANVAGRASHRAPIAAEVLETIRQYNHLDLELYDFGRQLFARRLEAVIPDLGEKLPALQRRVAAAERRTQFWEKFRSWCTPFRQR